MLAGVVLFVLMAGTPILVGKFSSLEKQALLTENRRDVMRTGTTREAIGRLTNAVTVQLNIPTFVEKIIANENIRKGSDERRNVWISCMERKISLKHAIT